MLTAYGVLVVIVNPDDDILRQGIPIIMVYLGVWPLGTLGVIPQDLPE